MPCSPVHLLHIFRTRFYENTSGGLLLKVFKGFLKYSRLSLKEEKKSKTTHCLTKRNVIFCR